jgi:hypothetical protein
MKKLLILVLLATIFWSNFAIDNVSANGGEQPSYECKTEVKQFLRCNIDPFADYCDPNCQQALEKAKKTCASNEVIAKQITKEVGKEAFKRFVKCLKK